MLGGYYIYISQVKFNFLIQALKLIQLMMQTLFVLLTSTMKAPNIKIKTSVGHT